MRANNPTPGPLYPGRLVHLDTDWFLKSLLAISLLLFAGISQAAPLVGIAVENDLDSNGNITVVEGGTVRVAYTTIVPSDKRLNKKDTIQLRRVDDDSLVHSVQRGKKKNGTVSLKVKKAVGEQLYVQYRRKGKNGDVIAREHHPSDPGFTTPLVAIARASVGDLAIGLNALEDRVYTASVSVAGAAFHDKSETDPCNLSQGSFWVQYDTGTSCDAFASIQFPDGVTLDGMKCLVFDNNSQALNMNIRVFLKRRDLTNGAQATIFLTSASADSAVVQEIIGGVPVEPVIDNSRYAYFLWADFGFGGTNSADMRLLGCTVSYS